MVAKKWLFDGHDDAGRTAAMWYTLLASAERHGVNPQHYLASVQALIASLPAEDLGRLLPDAWHRDNAAATAEALPSA